MVLHATPLGCPSWHHLLVTYIHIRSIDTLVAVSSSIPPPFLLPAFLSAPVFLLVSVVRSLSGKFLLLHPPAIALSKIVNHQISQLGGFSAPGDSV